MFTMQPPVACLSDEELDDLVLRPTAPLRGVPRWARVGWVAFRLVVVFCVVRFLSA